VLRNEALFAGDGSSGYTNLWLTNGTVAGTEELAVAGQDAYGFDPSLTASLVWILTYPSPISRDGGGRQTNRPLKSSVQLTAVTGYDRRAQPKIY